MQTSYFLPPEWHPQSAVMLTWPHRLSYWADSMASIDMVFTHTALAISARQKLLITCLDDQHVFHVQNLLKNIGAKLQNIYFYKAPTDDIWVRDHGPLTVYAENKPKLLDFIFTGWGHKYPAENDNVVTQNLYGQRAFPGATRLKVDLALEGGAIEVDGKGTLLTTRSCLLSQKRNPGITEEGLIIQLKTLFGVKRILWLEHGALEGDDTDRHIDTLARFIDPHTICYVQCKDKKDPHYATFQAMEGELQAFKDYLGAPYRLIPLPWPQARYALFDGKRLPLTYANFLIINDAVLVPTYDDLADEEALVTIGQCFPDREVVAISSLAIVQWYGSLHCMTMQLPQGVV